MSGDLTVWGRLSSGNVQKVIWALEELELPYHQIDLAGPYGGNDTPEYLALNPNGLVPTLRDGSLVIWESHAILRYLAAQYASGLLWPVEPAERALADQWTDWTATTFQPAWIGVFWNVVRTPKAQQDQAVIDNLLATSNRLFRLIDAQLAKTSYLAGEQLTYADIAAGAAMYRWMTMEIEREDLPHLASWHARLLERKAFRKGVCVSYAELVGRLAF